VSKRGKKASKYDGAKTGKSCLPKKKCCVSKDKCRRCPLLALKRGTLPDGYTVRKRKLVKLDKKTKLPKAA
jgi:hypothetical protein